ncbi:hypothetical protein EsVE80_04880 [Enterococcus saigonensis]|uniref:Uncharacterized protein n=1 Tax=Enterococcus saigonensis TaxID=1805431 RepID=A0A679II31_9ENTE|nr:hypothetical protein [Enterococcus saigonensis]BCA84965.1 hypothetical protein EsVE80_04880 [Enterococcus saigonensis]
MKLKRDVLGVVLAFMTAGFIATEINADAYQKVYDTQTKQEQKIHQVVNSEFISNQDKKDLQQTVMDFDKAKTKENRDSLQEKNIYQEKLLTKITSRLEKRKRK